HHAGRPGRATDGVDRAAGGPLPVRAPHRAHGVLQGGDDGRRPRRPHGHRRRRRPRLAPPAPSTGQGGRRGRPRHVSDTGSTTPAATSARSANRRIARSYGPLLAIAVAFTIM